ncbi:MAG: tetratricopeptide repeat protein [Pseudomonadota bacterium]
MGTLLFVSAIAMSAPPSVHAQSLADAFAYLQSGDYAAARKAVEPFVEDGDPNALSLLGFMEERGLGGPPNVERAIALYSEAAQAGSADAQFALGELAMTGAGVKQDFERGLAWLRLAAEQGHPQAHVNLGMAFASGAGVKRDMKKAIGHFREAAEAGDAGAQYNLGVAHLVGQGVKRDYPAAAEWFEKASAQGHAESQYNLALLFESDYLGAPDPVRAVELMQAAAEGGLPSACVAVGLMHYDGRLPATSAEDAATKAADWFERAALAGDPQGQFLFAAALAKGEGRTQNPEEAKTFLREALKGADALPPETVRNAQDLLKELDRASGG